MEDPIQFTVTVSYRGAKTSLTATSLPDLQRQLEAEFHIPAANQKLIAHGTLLTTTASLASTAHATLMGTPASQLSSFQSSLERKQKGAANRAKYTATSSDVASRTRNNTRAGSRTTGFSRLEPLASFSDAHRAHALLQRLANDAGVKGVMERREYRVGVLRELHPNQKTILGYNRNRGEEIALRLRTDDLDGFREYASIRTVLMHELAHMVWDEHDENFHSLNRELCKQVVELDWTRGGRRLAAKGEFYDPESHVSDAAAVDGGALGDGGFVLGGGEDLALPAERSERSEMAFKAWERRSRSK